MLGVPLGGLGQWSVSLLVGCRLRSALYQFWEDGGENKINYEYKSLLVPFVTLHNKKTLTSKSERLGHEAIRGDKSVCRI